MSTTRSAPKTFPDNLRVTAYRIKREGPLRVPDVLLKSIGFIGRVYGEHTSTDDVDPIATTFLVSVPSNKIPGGRFSYAITARHVFNEQEPETVIVVNKKDGGVGFLPVLGPWFGHPDASVDVAVMPVLYDASIDVTAFDIEDFFDESNNPENIGPGDEVFFPGLFTPAPGRERVLPLVRHGNIAMIPNQQIQTNEGYQDVYLIEARSIGGLSGSPVFARETLALPVSRGAEKDLRMQGFGRFKLFGLIKAHWDVDESKMNQARVNHDPKRGVNFGIAQVVPAKKLLEAINGPSISALRKGVEEKFLSDATTSNDAGLR